MISLRMLTLAAYCHAHDRPCATLATETGIVAGMVMSCADRDSWVSVETIPGSLAAVQDWLGY